MRRISIRAALKMVSGKTEKRGGTNPSAFIRAAQGNGSTLRFGNVLLSKVRKNEAGTRYDGTVDKKLARNYAGRSTSAPPVILTAGRKTNKLNVIDGGHRVSAARLRGDRFTTAIVSVRKRVPSGTPNGGQFSK